MHEVRHGQDKRTRHTGLADRKSDATDGDDGGAGRADGIARHRVAETARARSVGRGRNADPRVRVHDAPGATDAARVDRDGGAFRTKAVRHDPRHHREPAVRAPLGEEENFTTDIDAAGTQCRPSVFGDAVAHRQVTDSD